MAIGANWWVSLMFIYLAVFLTAACSTAATVVADVVVMCDAVYVSATLTSHAIMNVRPTANLSDLMRPMGSFVAGTWARLRALQITLVEYA